MPAEIDYVCKLPPDVVERAKNELGEDEFRRTESILAMREWLKKQPHLSSMNIGNYKAIRMNTSLTTSLTTLWITIDTITLLNFLRGCKYSLEKAKKKLDLTFTLRGALPEFFGDWDPMAPDIQEALKLGCE